jgi:hypothetical protein
MNDKMPIEHLQHAPQGQVLYFAQNSRPDNRIANTAQAVPATSML